MYVKKCYIENFGKLHKFEYEFSDGLNVINKLNGWGKTTLSTFIKAMFFGFDNTNKRAVAENERKKYYPWQGGKFGGNLEFEIDGKIYKIERFFGIKEKDDSFKLYNQTTNCEIDDFSENIGEEIFKIDKEAYERSTYISGQAISIKINDSISAKLSNVLESDNDISSSEAAINKITLEMKEYKKIGNKGKINELENLIIDKKRELEYAKKNEELINERNKKIQQIELQIKKCEEHKNINQAKVNRISEQENNELKRKLELLNEKLELQKKIEKTQEKVNKQKNSKFIISILLILLGIILGITISKYLYGTSTLGILILIIESINNKKMKENYKKEYKKMNEIDKEINTQKDAKQNKEEIIKENEILNKNINLLINQKIYDENELNRITNTEVPIEEIENELENLEQELKDMNKKYDILEKTREYLVKAKEEFSSHYLGKMTQGFNEYLKLMDEENLNTSVDIRLNVKLQENGENKESDYLSTGYKDLIGICIRFSLIDALFENEKPFIILDDPFVNLDEEKLEKAKKILIELSKKYQIIYFICHESRK